MRSDARKRLDESIARLEGHDDHPKFEAFKAKVLENPEARAAYDAAQARHALFDELADLLGAMPEAHNVFDLSDEATTVVSTDVETIAHAVIAAGWVPQSVVEQREADLRERIAAVIERLGLDTVTQSQDWLVKVAARVARAGGGA